MSEPQIVLVRHGETEWSRDRRHTGRADIPLNARGREQAAALSGPLSQRAFGLVLSSPLSRARETCELAGFGDRARLRDDLVEWDYGAYEGRSTADIRKERPDWNVFDGGIEGGESVEQVGVRADRIIAEVSGREDDTLVFAHGHLLRVVAARWLDLGAARARSFELSTAAISVLGHEHDHRTVFSWNDDHHLAAVDDGPR